MAVGFEALKRRWQQEKEAAQQHSAACRDVLRESCRPLFQRYGIHKAVVYGSIADGTARPGSDVDLLVIPLDNELYWDFLHELEDLLDRPVDLYTDRDEARWVQKILARGQVVYEA